MPINEALRERMRSRVEEALEPHRDTPQSQQTIEWWSRMLTDAFIGAIEAYEEGKDY